VQASDDLGRPRPILDAHVWRRLTVVCRLKAMRAGHVRRRLTAAWGPRAMRAGNTRWRLSDLHYPRPMRTVHGRRQLSDAHRPRSMLAFHGQCRLTDVACRWTMSFARYAHATSDVCRPWQMRACLGLCCMSLANVSFLRRADHERCRLRDAGRPRPISPSRCAHATINACWPWMMLHVVGRRRWPDAHMPHQMRAGLGWCRLPLADVACSMPTCHVRCVV